MTDDDTLEAAVMGLVGTASTQLVAALVLAGSPSPLGLSGVDAGLVSVSALNPALGWVGTPVQVDGSRAGKAPSQCGFVPLPGPHLPGPSRRCAISTTASTPTHVAAAVAAAVKATSP